MKKFILFARLYTSLIFIFPLTVAAQLVDHYPNYVVIGAFAHHKNAVKFTDDANQNKFPARFEINPKRNLYYVYVLSTDDRDFAIAEAVKLRADTKYFDTWVYCGALGKMVLANAGGPQDLDVDPLTGKVIEHVGSEINSDARDQDPSINQRAFLEPRVGDGPAEEQFSAEGTALKDGANRRTVRKTAQRKTENEDQKGDEKNSFPSDIELSALSGKQPLNSGSDQRSMQEGGEQMVSPLVSGSEQNPALNGNQALNSGSDQHLTEKGGQPLVSAEKPSTSKTQEPAPQDDRELSLAPAPTRATTEPLKAEDVVNKGFYFHIFRADNGKTIGGEVDAIDFERARLMATYEGNTPVSVRMPSGKTKQVSFLCQVFGYRKLQQEFNPTSPSEDLYLDDKGNLVVPFELVRLQKGDIAIMYNVFFFKDAAVMRPESRYEVNNLLELLNENPSYKIIIHGHTNGNASGKIIRMDTPGNFYSLTGTKEGFGSAKKLSEERAIVIREFLISSGIQADRMEVQAWGGKKPIHDKHSVRAHENVRVEIEILSK